MGRLQRKKSVKKKKKTESAVADDAQSQSVSTAKAVAESSSGDAAAGQKAVVSRKPSVVAKTPAPAKPRDNFITKSTQFLREVKVELKKVAWPSRKQTIGSTVVVLILVTIIAFFLGVVDIGLSSLVKLVLQ